MPVAIPMREALDGATVAQVVSAIAAVAVTLARLKKDHGVAHRDIKPDNLYSHDGQWVVGDFGLVAIPNLEGLTEEGRALGPIHYMADEMLRDPQSADATMADVYALAKTLWVLCTGQKYPPDGHQPAGTRGFSISDYRYDPRNGALDKLIDRATRVRPSQRPSMEEMANELITWSSISAGRRGVDVQDARVLLRSKLEGELTAQDDAESRKEMALAALRRLNELVEPLNGALQELHPRASIDGTADKFMQNIVRTGDYSGQPEERRSGTNVSVR